MLCLGFNREFWVLLFFLPSSIPPSQLASPLIGASPWAQRGAWLRSPLSGPVALAAETSDKWPQVEVSKRRGFALDRHTRARARHAPPLGSAHRARWRLARRADQSGGGDGSCSNVGRDINTSRDPERLSAAWGRVS